MNVGEPLLLVACERQPQPHKPSHSPYVLRCFRRGEGAGRNRNGQNEYAKRRSHLSFLFTLISLLIVVIKSRHSITQRFPIGIAVDIASSIRSPTNLKRINRTNLPGRNPLGIRRGSMRIATSSMATVKEELPSYPNLTVAHSLQLRELPIVRAGMRNQLCGYGRTKDRFPLLRSSLRHTSWPCAQSD